MFDKINAAAQDLLGAVAEGNDSDGAKLTAATQNFTQELKAVEAAHAEAVEANASELEAANAKATAAEEALETARQANASQVEELNARATAAEDALATANETIEAKEAELTAGAAEVEELKEANNTLSAATAKMKEDIDAVASESNMPLTAAERYAKRLAAVTPKKEN